MIVSSSSQLGAAFRQRRKDLRLTQQDLADLASVSVRFLSDLENGKETARLGLVIAVASALGWRIEANVAGASDERPQG